MSPLFQSSACRPSRFSMSRTMRACPDNVVQPVNPASIIAPVIHPECRASFLTRSLSSKPRSHPRLVADYNRRGWIATGVASESREPVAKVRHGGSTESPRPIMCRNASTTLPRGRSVSHVPGLIVRRPTQTTSGRCFPARRRLSACSIQLVPHTVTQVENAINREA